MVSVNSCLIVYNFSANYEKAVQKLKYFEEREESSQTDWSLSVQLFAEKDNKKRHKSKKFADYDCSSGSDRDEIPAPPKPPFMAQKSMVANTLANKGFRTQKRTQSISERADPVKEYSNFGASTLSDEIIEEYKTQNSTRFMPEGPIPVSEYSSSLATTLSDEITKESGIQKGKQLMPERCIPVPIREASNLSSVMDRVKCCCSGSEGT